MNLPNKLTMLRMIAVPIFVAIMYMAKSDMFYYNVALIIFALASLTDWLDGYLARRDGIVTKFGILMDPLADKILVAAAMICFVEIEIAPAWVVVTIISREFLVTSIRLVAAGEGKVIAADKLGKYKTALQMVWICIGLYLSGYNYGMNIGVIIYLVLMYVVLLLTVISGVNYVIKNKDCFSQ